MGDTIKLKGKVERSDPTDPSGGTNIKSWTFDVDKKPMDEKQNRT